MERVLNRNYRLRSACFLLFLFLVCCQSKLTPEEQYSQILESDSTCEVPCWNGIEPGQTTEQNFLDLVETTPKDIYHELRQIDLRPTGTQYLWTDETTQIPMKMELHDEVVTFTSFLFGGNLKLSSVIELLGEPDFYTARVARAESTMFNLFAYYEDEGVLVHVQEIPFNAPSSASKPICQIELYPEIPVHRLYYLEPGNISDLSQRMERITVVSEVPRPWSGFGTLDLTTCM